MTASSLPTLRSPAARGAPRRQGEDLEIWIDRRYVPAGYGWSFPADDELRIGVGSFDPRFHVRETTELLAEDLGRDRVRYQGNWIPHKLRRATEGGVFFVGDSAGHCLPLSAEGIRTASTSGSRSGASCAASSRAARAASRRLARYAEFNDSHEWKFRWMLRVQKLVPRVPPRLLAPPIRLYGEQRFIDWSFGTTCGSRRRSSPAAQRTIRTVPARRRATPSSRSALSETCRGRTRRAGRGRPPR